MSLSANCIYIRIEGMRLYNSLVGSLSIVLSPYNLNEYAMVCESNLQHCE
jgi:hypothetical protein